MNPATILIVEDEAIVAADLGRKLSRLGYEVVGTAGRGDEAVEIAGCLCPDLVLMDILLNGQFDGIAAAQAIRNQFDLPVIYLTAHSDAVTLARAKITGPFGYILKPFDERDLATQIELALYKHRADRQQREQRELLRVTLTSIGDAVIATDFEGCVNFINPVAESLTGWQAEEAMGRPITEVFRIVNEQTGQPLEAPVARVLSEGRAVALANHAAVITRDGRSVPIEDSAAPILDAAGKVIGAVLVFHDVTEKRRSDEALLVSEQRTREILESITDAFYAVDADWRLTYVNGKAKELWGFAWEDLVGTRLWSLFPNYERTDVYREHMRAMQKRQPVHYETISPKLKFWIEANIYPTADGGLSVYFRDVSDRKKAEERERREHLETAFANRVLRAFVEFEGDTLFDRVLAVVQEEMTSRHGVFGYISQPGHLVCPSLSKMLDACEVKGKCIHYPPEKWKGLWARALTEKRSLCNNEVQHVPCGHPKIHNNLAAPILFNGEAIGLLNIANKKGGYTDADCGTLDRIAARIAPLLYAWIQRKLREDERQAAQEALRESNQELNEYAYALTHNLKAPFRAVQNYAGFLTEDLADKLEDEPKQYLEGIKKAIIQATDQFKDLESLYRVRNYPVDSEAFELAELLHEMQNIFQNNSGREIVVAPKLPTLNCCKFLIRQILLNVIENGFKYNRADIKKVEVGWQPGTDNRLDIFVRDNGIGIDPKYHDHIFGIFKRLHTNSEYEGSGIGLAIVKRAVQNVDGEIRVESAVGEGSTFYVNLPDSIMENTDYQS